MQPNPLSRAQGPSEDLGTPGWTIGPKEPMNEIDRRRLAVEAAGGRQCQPIAPTEIELANDIDPARHVRPLVHTVTARPTVDDFEEVDAVVSRGVCHPRPRR